MYQRDPFLGSWSVPSEIIRGELYLGGRSSTVSEDELLSRKVTHIVSITTDDVTLPGEKFKQYHVRLEDEGESNLSSHFEDIFRFMREAVLDQQAVLVHCEAGISRSATTVIAYLMKFHSMTLGQAFEHTKERRRIINPNTGFVEQLRRFEHTVRDVKEGEAFNFVLYWLRNYYYLLKDVPEEEVRSAWTLSGGDLQRTWDSLYDTYEEKYLPTSFPASKT